MRPTRALARALTATVLLTACGPQSHLRFNLRTVGVTVPRIIAPAVQLVAPSAPPPVALPPVAPVIDQLPARPPSAVTPIAAPKNPCPPAPALAVPKHAATETIDNAPPTQAFGQRASGDFASPAAKGSLAGTVQVTVTDLPDSTTSTGQSVKAWRVQQVDPATKTRAVEIYQLVLPSAAPGAMDAGIYLVGVGWDDPVRGTVTFQPTGNGLFVLPSPVQVAQNDAQYAGIATDPDTLTTLELVRNVRARKRIDVCGQLVDTWTVEMTGTLTTPTAQWNVTWNQQIATAYSGVDVDELLGLQDVKGGLSWTRRLVSTTVPEEVR